MSSLETGGPSLPKPRKSGVKRANKTAKAEPELLNPGGKILTGKTTAKLAASRGVSEATLLADYRSSLRSHGEQAEDRMPKEFSTWLVKFARAVDSDDVRTDAWHELKSSCDTLVLINNLYLFGYPGKTSADVLQDTFRFLKQGLDKLLPRYSTLSEDTSTLFNDPKLLLLAVLSEDVPRALAEPIRFIVEAKAVLRAAREWAKEMGSYKSEAHDFHLYAMATSVREATGEYHFAEIVTLLEAARAAHGFRDDPLNEASLKKRVQRYITRMNLPRPRPPACKEAH